MDDDLINYDNKYKAAKLFLFLSRIPIMTISLLCWYLKYFICRRFLYLPNGCLIFEVKIIQNRQWYEMKVSNNFV